MPAARRSDVGVLGRHHEEGRAEQRVGAGGEDGVVDAELLAAEGHLGALAAPDPVALHRLDVLGPVDRVEVAQQPLGVVGDAQEPLLELADLDERAAALAVAVGVDLLVGEHGLVFGAPLDGRLLAVGEARRGTAPGRSTASSGSRRGSCVASSRDQSIEIPHERNWRWKEAIDSAVESRGCTPVLIAWFSAGSPKAS